MTRKWTLLLTLAAAAAPPLSAQRDAKKITIAQLEQALAGDHGKPDDSIAEQLSHFELTERASSVRLARWEDDFRGAKTRDALMMLADDSALLNLPAAEIPTLAVPEFKTQSAMMSRSLEYVSKTIPKLPNFLAVRETTQVADVEERPDYARGGGSDLLGGVQSLRLAPGTIDAGLRVLRRFSIPVAYRDGKEVAEMITPRGKQAATQAPNAPLQGLTTSGEFGPILGLVFADAVRGSIRWARWEQGAAGPEAVFRYKVPQAKSHDQVAFSFAGEMRHVVPAYHGEIGIDAATGAVLRLTVIADLPAPYQRVTAATLVEYGPVSIGAHDYNCPLRAVAISRLPLSHDEIEAAEPNAPLGTEINDVAFTRYHVFRSQSRIVDRAEAEPAEAPVAAPAAVADAPIPTATMPVEAAPEPAAVAQTMPVAAPPAAAIVQPTPEPQPVAEIAAPPMPRADATILHASANLVLLDIVVTDHDKAVHGLDRARFHIFENGREHPITSFTEHTPAAAAAAVTPVALPPQTYSNVPIYPQGPALTVLLLDGLNTDRISQNEVRRQMIEYLGKLPQGTALAIFTLSSRLRMIQGFTTNTAQLLDALQHYSIGAHPGDKMSNGSEAILSSGASDLGNSGAILPGMTSMIIRMMQFAADAKVQDIDQRVSLTMDGLQQLARYLSAVPGRKNLIWFSGSFPLALGPTDDLSFRAQADPMKDQRSYEVAVRRTSDLLATARVAVYPVDARGVVETTAFTAGMSTTPSVVPGPAGGMINAHSVPQGEVSFAHKDMAEGDSMTEIADETGGHAFLSNNDLKASLGRVIENSSSYYTIGYSPGGKLDGGFRNLKVALDGAHYALSYRKGYYANDPLHPTAADLLEQRAHNPLLVATLPGSPAATQILFQARVRPSTDPELAGKHLDEGEAGEKTASLHGPLRRYVADLTVDPQTITFTTQPNGTQRVELEFALVGYDGDSKRVNNLERSVQLDLTSVQFGDVLAKGLRVRLLLDLPAGPGALRVAVFDPATTHAGSLEVPIRSDHATK